MMGSASKSRMGVQVKVCPVNSPNMNSYVIPICNSEVSI